MPQLGCAGESNFASCQHSTRHLHRLERQHHNGKRLLVVWNSRKASKKLAKVLEASFLDMPSSLEDHWTAPMRSLGHFFSCKLDELLKVLMISYRLGDQPLSLAEHAME